MTKKISKAVKQTQDIYEMKLHFIAMYAFFFIYYGYFISD